MIAKELCPVSEIIGGHHYFIVGTGEIVEWDIMGDGREKVEVCKPCTELKNDYT